MAEHPAVRSLVGGMTIERFRRALGDARDTDHLPPSVDLRRARDRDALIGWLRSWGCRHLRLEDHTRTSRALRRWAIAWADRIPRAPLASLGPTAIDRAARGYEALAATPAAFSARAGGLVEVTFGSTAASKALYALRPATCAPWDAPMRVALDLGDGADGFARYLELCADAIRATARRSGIPQRRLPAALGRPETTAARLVDEYLWREITYAGRATRARPQPATPPPSTGSAAPVTKDASSLARNRTARATSSARPIRPSGRSDAHST